MKKQFTPSSEFPGRRAFLKNGALILSGLSLPQVSGIAAGALPADKRGAVRIGLVTDLHYADKPPAGSRHYRETLAKLQEAATQYENDRPDFVVFQGDLIDSGKSLAQEKQHLQTVVKAISAIPYPKYYVLGNHCVDQLKKDEFLQGVGQKESFYAFDQSGYHFVILDACFKSDGTPYGRKNFKWTDANIPPEELSWLQSDLKQTPLPTIVFVHQPLDLKDTDSHAVKNSSEVRKVLEQSGKVTAVFQGHSHHNKYSEIKGIHYCTLVAMVEGSGIDNNGYSVLDIYEDGSLVLNGFRKQKDYHWS
ncbi:metallophosphoesterase [Gimesia sp.]|uniref:metallophosphoesterase family protein n=1 Tax=Gimesia sp. TaxID=2024833 RepID=UPI000C57C196|nr:metallophosphoesterase [Gimesia sp.]MAX35424.1 alkaline phosphatase [Gimesia sp.]HAH43510.1 alkaline phosphatase [Planctomycetaceae bacterium]HBL41948.1 alkaline phosphatase [Planctomycetaceae bacterium]|tara:strand:- start:8051 stop:8968 length:918 start_codon:yes stop_codon:yes gene_type:complete